MKIFRNINVTILLLFVIIFLILSVNAATRKEKTLDQSPIEAATKPTSAQTLPVSGRTTRTDGDGVELRLTEEPDASQTQLTLVAKEDELEEKNFRKGKFNRYDNEHRRKVHSPKQHGEEEQKYSNEYDDKHEKEHDKEKNYEDKYDKRYERRMSEEDNNGDDHYDDDDYCRDEELTCIDESDPWDYRIKNSYVSMKRNPLWKDELGYFKGGRFNKVNRRKAISGKMSTAVSSTAASLNPKRSAQKAVQKRQVGIKKQSLKSKIKSIARKKRKKRLKIVQKPLSTGTLLKSKVSFKKIDQEKKADVPKENKENSQQKQDHTSKGITGDVLSRRSPKDIQEESDLTERKSMSVIEQLGLHGLEKPPKHSNTEYLLRLAVRNKNKRGKMGREKDILKEKRAAKRRNIDLEKRGPGMLNPYLYGRNNFDDIDKDQNCPRLLRELYGEWNEHRHEWTAEKKIEHLKKMIHELKYNTDQRPASEFDEIFMKLEDDVRELEKEIEESDTRQVDDVNDKEVEMDLQQTMPVDVNMNEFEAALLVLLIFMFI